MQLRWSLHLNSPGLHPLAVLIQTKKNPDQCMNINTLQCIQNTTADLHVHVYF